MPFIQCASCGGSGTKQVQRAKVVTENGKDKIVTETVTENCPGCNGAGVISR
jgi:hypothetical protein